MKDIEDNKNFFHKLKQRPFYQRAILFVLLLVIWFWGISIFSIDAKNSVQHAKNDQGFWLLTVLFVTILSPIFFNRKRL